MSNEKLTEAERVAVEVRRTLFLTLHDTPAGHLSLAAWRRIQRTFEGELEKERAALSRSMKETRDA